MSSVRRATAAGGPWDSGRASFPAGVRDGACRRTGTSSGAPPAGIGGARRQTAEPPPSRTASSRDRRSPLRMEDGTPGSFGLSANRRNLGGLREFADSRWGRHW